VYSTFAAKPEEEVGMRLGMTEIRILQALAAGDSPSPSSNQRTRLEMLGLVKDGPGGLYLTPEGRALAGVAVPTPHETLESPERALSANGRRKGPRPLAGL
jgi:hypothetical protein